MGIFGCDHKWEKVDKEVLKSPYEQTIGRGPISFKCPTINFFTRKVVWLIQCTRCGKFKTITKENG
jgi:hypothetical protein